ncbi:copper resistance system multicopper oxidase [Spongiibacter sp. KMU-158]|uniref:Copper resistance system multicopper oxidase n=2 Tax=Spongiibacter pelagi TaxID=2760804 RepID=A0A927GWS3_9GAMM|nr:copper resistance system multicopper oxidase [Spongiibacter pelagi]
MALTSLGLPSAKVRAAGLLAAQPAVLSGRQFNLDIGYQQVNFTGAERTATTVNGSLPAPILRWKEGEQVSLRVTNHLAHDTSLHWHGMILPYQMDGVPGLSYAGIKPGETFEYRFDVKQSGTYWYHSHSGFQEQTGLYGAIVIDPKEPDPVAFDREYVVLLSDWSDTSPESIYANLKKLSHYYNFQERTVGDLWHEIREKGVTKTWQARKMWNQMRMSQADIADVTGYTYTYLMNGNTPASGWMGLFSKGEKIRLRFINGSAMSIFDVRIPGLKMTVVAADGQNIEPVTVDEFRIATAETYDVIVEPAADQAYTVFAQSIDRTGYARGTLAPDPSLQALIPAMDPRPVLSHRDMGMAHDGHDMGVMDHDMSAMGNDMGHDMSTMKHDMSGHSMHSQAMNAHVMNSKPGPAGFGSQAPVVHKPSERGPQTDMQAMSPLSGLDDQGIGLRDHAQLYGRKVLRYADIRNLTPTLDKRDPEREIQMHLTGNMSRYMWSIDGIKYADAEPVRLHYGERVRITLVNDTMMTHPMHLHGMWSELETGDPDYIPRKHTVIVQPGSKISYLVTADALGRWAYHCHMLYHMPGMHREVRVEHGGKKA